MNRPAAILSPAVRRARRSRGRTLAEMMIALGVFATATLGIWECIRTVFFLSAKNTGLNLSHTALQNGVDRMAERLRDSLQIIDVASFDGTTFTDIPEAKASGNYASGNAVRFLRLIPVSIFMWPDDGKTYTMTSPEASRDPQNPDDFLTAGNKTVKGTYSYNPKVISLTDPNFLADMANARLLPRFPYVVETVSTGSCQGTLPMPGMDLAGMPTYSGTNAITITLANGLPPTTVSRYPVPSCNLAYLVTISAVAVLNRSQDYAEMIYYPDAMNLTRKDSLTQAIAPSATGSGPQVFSLPKAAGAFTDPSARGSLQVSIPVYAPYLGNTVVRRGGAAALNNVELNLPVETRRRAQF